MGKKVEEVWFCNNCNGAGMTKTEMIEHMEKEHKIAGKNLQGERKMTKHLDGSDWFSSQYDWNIQGILLQQSVRCERDDNDLMRLPEVE